MQALAVWRAVTNDHANLLERLIALLTEHGIRYCVIGGQAINAYADPLISLSLDLAVATEDLGEARALLERAFDVKEFPHSLNISLAGSDLRVQIQTDPRYGRFVERAERRNVLGLILPVGRLDDVLQGKLWALQDPARRPSKQSKDLADIHRVIEAHPHLRALVPADILARLP